MTKPKRSPLKDKPLRNPGQSLEEQIRDEIEDIVIGPILFALIFVLLAGLEWVRYFRPFASSPILFSVIAVGAVGFATYRCYRFWSHLSELKLGRDGEKEVGQNLEDLRRRGYQVFHDIGGNTFNIDHVLIGPAGVFTVETKTRRKPSGDSRIVFDGVSIQGDGFGPASDPVVQAKAQAAWLRELLAQSTGRTFDVRPVIVYPGWFVDYTGPKNRMVWVLNPKALPAFLDHEQSQLTPEDVQLAGFHLSRFVRGGYGP